MPVLDEQGRLFGRVNVVDAAVVVVVVGLVVAGGVLLLSGGGDDAPGEETETQFRNATLALGPTAGDVAQQVSTGDALESTAGGGTLTVTDTQITSTGDGRTVVYVSGRYAVGNEPASDGGRFQAGTSLTVQTDAYRIAGTVVNTNTSTTTLPVAETRVFVESEVPATVASAVETGDRFTAANATVGRVESVAVVPAADPDRKRVRLGVTLTTVRIDGVPSFARRPVKLDSNLSFHTTQYDLTATVENVGSHAPRGTAENATLRIRASAVTPAVADALSVGTAETHAGSTATITAVDSEPSPVVVRTDSGELLVRDHPRLLDVTLTVEATVHRRDGATYFHGRRLQRNGTVRLDFGTVTVDGRVLDAELGG